MVSKTHSCFESCVTFFSPNNYQGKRNCLLRDYLCGDIWKAKQSCKISAVRDHNLEEENRKHKTSEKPKINDSPAKESSETERYFLLKKGGLWK